MLTETTTLHAANGLILWFRCRNGDHFDCSRVVNSFPWDWIAAVDQIKAKSTFAMASIGHMPGPVRYQLDPAIFGGDWMVETEWIRLPTADSPILGISKTWRAVMENLSPRERDVAKLLPKFSVKQIAQKLGITASTVDTHRARLLLKLNLASTQLVAWCQSHRELL